MMKGLIENECGGQNPLMKLASHFNNTSEQKLTQDAIKNLRQAAAVAAVANLNSDQLLVNEYLNQHVDGNNGSNSANISIGSTRGRPIAAPRTFQMENLFNELKQIDKTSQSYQSTQSLTNTLLNINNPSSLINSTNSNGSSDWTQEYWSGLQQKQQQQSGLMLDERSFKWSTDYLNQSEAATLLFDEAWENLMLKNNNNTSNMNNSQDNLLLNLTANNILANSNNKFGEANNSNQLNDEMRKTANELLDSMQDNRFSETEFLQFVRDLSANAAALNSNKSQIDNNNNQSSKHADLIIEGDDLVNEWINEFQSLASANKLNNNSAKANDELDYWNDLQNEWNLAASANPNHPWLDEFQKVYDSYKTYEFDKENPLKTHPNPFEEGLERLKVHDIVNAVLLFEVAVQKDPSNMLAWQYLGTTQVKNEQDAQAIRALRKCLELKPDNLIALSTLATSYTNESMQRLAFESLIKWLKYHPDYSHLLKNDEHAAKLMKNLDINEDEKTSNGLSSAFSLATMGVVHVNDFMDLQEIFLKAVRESASKPSKIDPDLQCCLGVLFHLSNEYDKAADCFKTALQVKPDDYLLWNKLGATYANNNRNEEAIDAYYQALKLCPGFVRARYNLGIGCMNLGAYKESIEHFLTALVQQSQASLSNNNDKQIKIQQMSETIWSTLRLALSYLNRNDLYASCINKDLEFLKKEFKIE